MSGYNLRSRKVEIPNIIIEETNSSDENSSIEETISLDTNKSTEDQSNNLLVELETLRENNKNLYSKYNNISRSKLRMKHVIEEKEARINKLENRIKELLEKQESYCESKELSEDWVSLE